MTSAKLARRFRFFRHRGWRLAWHASMDNQLALSSFPARSSIVQTPPPSPLPQMMSSAHAPIKLAYAPSYYLRSKRRVGEKGLPPEVFAAHALTLVNIITRL